MKDFIKRMALAGIGFAYIGKDKLEEMARDISKNMDVSEEEGRKVAQEILDETEKTRNGFEESARKSATKALEKMDLPSGEEVKKLEQRIKTLEKKVSELSKS